MGTVYLKGKEESRPMLKVFSIRHCFRQRPGKKRKARDKGLREAARSTVSNATQQIRGGQRNNYTFDNTKASWNLDMAFVRQQRRRSDQMELEWKQAL